MNCETIHATDSSSHVGPVPSICIIIPTFNRADVILLCLEHLERQSFTDFEVVVIDDGSTDDTPALLKRFLNSTRMHMTCRRQENAGPARARNLAISFARAPVCLMIGDDILASPDLVKTHLEFHQQIRDTKVAALGVTQWSESLQKVTPFMRWLDESGVQFSYKQLLAGLKPNWLHFYTSNISVSTRLLRENPFNEIFSRSAWYMEDLELGYRLEKLRGLQITLLPKALAQHVHPTTFLRSCQRMQGVGTSEYLFHQLWPERRPPHSLLRKVRDALCRYPSLLRWLTATVELLTRVWCPNPMIKKVLHYHSGVGYRRGKSFAETLSSEST